MKATQKRTPPLNPSGMCQCGCGALTNRAVQTDRGNGIYAGDFRRYLRGHHGRKNYEILVRDHGCWEWSGPTSSHGYVYIKSSTGGGDYLHRIMYRRYKGEIAGGLDIDHLCRNKGCCNPEHLEAVTHRENVLRGECPTALTHVLGVCQRGHDMADAYVRPDGRQMCRQCCRLRDLARAAKGRDRGDRTAEHKRNSELRRQRRAAQVKT